MKPIMTGSRYVLAVKDLALSSNFYKSKLGFQTLWEGDGWHFLIREDIKIMIGECPDDVSAYETGCHSYFAYVEVNAIDELYREYKAKNVNILSAIEDKPWEQREFSIQTIDGHRIMFGETVRKK